MTNILHPVQVSKLVDRWLEEDVPSFDFAGHVVGSKPQSAVLLMKSDMADVVLAGCPFVQCIFDKLNCKVEFDFQEGSVLPSAPPVKIGTVQGPANRLLIGERIVLNCLSRASGIATEAGRYIRKLPTAYTTRVAGTRKTTPGFRMVEKYALMVGGADPHRYDLSSAVMLKDNHVWLAGSLSNAVKSVRGVAGMSVKIEVECRSVGEALEAIDGGCDVIMLDNFSPDAARVAAREIKARNPRVVVEISGNVTYQNIDKYAGPDVDVISTSKLVQGYPIVDFSMKIVVQGRDPSNPVVTLPQPGPP